MYGIAYSPNQKAARMTSNGWLACVDSACHLRAWQKNAWRGFSRMTDLRLFTDLAPAALASAGFFYKL
jgi:hypothetical protein